MTAGEKVVVYPWIGCGHALFAREATRISASSRGSSAFFAAAATPRTARAAQALLPRYRRPRSGDRRALRLLGITTFRALKKIDAKTLASEPIVVIGAGGLGLMCLSLMKAMGARAPSWSTSTPPSATPRSRPARSPRSTRTRRRRRADPRADAGRRGRHGGDRPGRRRAHGAARARLRSRAAGR